MPSKDHSLQRCLHLDTHEMVAWKGFGIRRPLLRKRRARKKWLAKLRSRRYDAKTVTFGFLYGGHFGSVFGNKSGDTFFVSRQDFPAGGSLLDAVERGYAELEFLHVLIHVDEGKNAQLIECLKQRENSGRHVIHQVGETPSLQSFKPEDFPRLDGPSLLTISETAPDGITVTHQEEDPGYGFSLEDRAPKLPAKVHLSTCSLLSKWGFGDGDDLDWLRYDFGVQDVHAVLFALVRDMMLPLLDQKVEIEQISTIHNPVRAYTVNGEDVTKYHYGAEEVPEGLITPAHVTFTGQEVLDFAMALGNEKETQ